MLAWYCGDLNLTLGLVEIWGGTTLEDTLSSYFKELSICYNLIDIPLLKAGPTWTNGRRGAENVSKRLDRFLVAEGLIDRFGRYRSWIDQVLASDHKPVTLQVEFEFDRVQYPFKFNRV